MKQTDKHFIDCSFTGLFGDLSLDLHGGNRGHMEVCGHRGGFTPHNSIESFTKALDNGVKIIELDVSSNFSHACRYG